MKMTHRVTIPTTLLVLLTTTACNSSDQQLAEFSERAARRQQLQNETIAKQSEAIIDVNRRSADATKALVDADAAARRELIRAQHQLNSEVHTERANVDRQREQLALEHREIAAQRNRDPMIAAAIEGAFLLIACLAPLILVAYALSRLDRGGDAAEELGEILLKELVISDHNPKLPNSLLALENQRPAASSHDDCTSVD